MTAILPRKWLVGKSMVLLSAVLQGNASSQYPSTRSLQGKRSEDRIVCKIGFVESFSSDANRMITRYELYSVKIGYKEVN